MRVLILANDVGGLWVFRRELLMELVKEHEVFYCVPDGKAVNAINEFGCHHIPCKLMERHGTNPLTEIKLISFYKKTIKKIKPDVVFTYTIKCNAYGGMACASLKVPYVANVTGLGSAIENGGMMQKISLFMYKRGLRKAQKVFFQNAENRDFMVKHRAVKGDYELIPGSGVNLDYYRLLPYPEGETVDFVFIARVMREKGIDQYLEAAKEIRKKHPETRFHICGFCEEQYEEILKKLEEDGIVIYHGLVSDMREIYKQISCTVHPTFYPEGLSNVLLESSASGRPIITTDRSGCREVIDNGINGYIVKQKDSQDLINAIGKFLNLTISERREMGIAGRNKVEKEFDRKIVIKKYMDEIIKLEKKIDEKNN